MKNAEFAVLTTKDGRCVALQTVVERAYDRAKKRKADVVKRFILCPHILGALTSFAIQTDLRLAGCDEPGRFETELGFEYALSKILNCRVLRIDIGTGHNATILYLLESSADLFEEWIVQEFPEAVVHVVQES